MVHTRSQTGNAKPRIFTMVDTAPINQRRNKRSRKKDTRGADDGDGGKAQHIAKGLDSGGSMTSHVPPITDSPPPPFSTQLHNKGAYQLSSNGYPPYIPFYTASFSEQYDAHNHFVDPMWAVDVRNQHEELNNAMEFTCENGMISYASQTSR